MVGETYQVLPLALSSGFSSLYLDWNF